MEKKLEINIPSIQTFLNHAYPLAILEKEEVFQGWFYTNYTQLYTFNNRKNPVGDFKIDFFSHNGKYPNIPFLEYSNINKNTVDTFNESILDIIIANIDLNYYVEVGIDEYYWSNKSSYMRRHFHHDNLIYGYNKKEKIFYYLGYNKEMLFGKYSVSFTEFISSFTENSESTIKFIRNFIPELLSETTRYVYHDNLEFDVDIFRVYLGDYLNSQNSFLSHKGAENSVFGLAIYDELILKFSDDMKISKDLRLYRILWEHKKVMKRRIEYLISKGYLDAKKYEEFSKQSMFICNECLLLKNLSIKYAITNNSKCYLSMITKIKEIQALEERFMNELYLAVT